MHDQELSGMRPPEELLRKLIFRYLLEELAAGLVAEFESLDLHFEWQTRELIFFSKIETREQIFAFFFGIALILASKKKYLILRSQKLKNEKIYTGDVV